MGAYLSQPVTKKESCDKASGKLSYGASEMQGWRVSMEVLESLFVSNKLSSKISSSFPLGF